MRRSTKNQQERIPLARRWWVGYGVAIGGTIIAALAQWALGQAARDLPTFITFYPVALIAAWVGGTGPGLFATVLSVLTANVLFMEPVGMVGPATFGQAMGMTLFIVMNSTISVFAGRLRAKSEALQGSETRLQMAHQAAHIGSFERDLQTGVNIWTPELEAMYGLKPGEFGGTEAAWEQLVHPQDRAGAIKAVERALASFQPEEGEWRVVRPDGSIHWLVGRFQAFKDHAGKARRLVGVNIDITDRKEAEHAVRQSAQRFRALETAGSYAVYSMSPDWSEMRALHGREFMADTNAPSRDWLEKYIDPKDQPGVLAAIHNAIDNRAVFESEHRVHRADGNFGWTFSRAVPVKDENGEIVEWVGTASDITNRKEAEQAVRQSEEQLRHFIDSAPVAIAMFDKEMRYLAVSRRWLETFPLSNQSVPGRSHYEVFPQIPEHWKQVHQRCLAGAIERADEDIFEDTDGRRLWVRWEIHPWYASQGVVGGIVIFTEDITDRKNAAEALQQSEQRFRTMANAIPQPAWIARPDGYICWFNLRAFEYTGATQEQLEGWAWESFLDPDVLPRVLEHWQHSLATGEPLDVDMPLRGADGQFRTFLTLAMPLKDPEGKVSLWFGTHTDVSEQKKAEAEITVLRDRLAADLAGMNRLHALSTRLVSEGDLQTLLKVILDAAIALTGGDKGHIQLMDPDSGKLELMDERGLGPAFVEYSSHIRPGVLASGLAIQTHQRVVVENITTSPLYCSDPRALDLVAGAGMRAVVCIPLLTRIGQLVGTLSVLFGTPHEPSERDLRLLDLLARQATDFIERTRAEESLRATRQQLADSNADLERKVDERTAKLREAMDELEHMSYSMVHDMRAPLRAMQGFAETLQQESEECRRPPAADYLRIIHASADRLDRLVTDALNYSKVVREGLPLRPVDLGELLLGMIQTYPNLQRADITVEFADLLVLGNQSLLTQCFGNVLDNAVKFVAENVKPRVRVWTEPSTIDNQPATSIYIDDNGIGIPKAAQEKMFRLFQKMHPETEYPGTGIGLAIARKAVERMNGRISLESEPGKGTRLQIDLRRPAEMQMDVSTSADALSVH